MARIGSYVTPFIVKVFNGIGDVAMDVIVEGVFDGAGKDGLKMSFILLVAILVDDGLTLTPFCDLLLFSTAH